MRAFSLVIKVVILAGLSLLIVVALFYVDSVITERQGFRNQAVESISASYASSQRILGPMFVQPYRVTERVESTDAKGAKTVSTNVTDNIYSFFPRELQVKGELQPSVRRHGLYPVTVYEFVGTVSGHFDVPALPVKGNVQYGDPYLAFVFKDVRGLVGRPALRVNGTAVAVQGALKTQEEQDSTVQAPVMSGANLRGLLPATDGKASKLDFSLDLNLDGTQEFEIVPLADTNHFELSSTWSQPLFSGRFLPHSREVGPAGFHAVWEISSLAAATQQQLANHGDNLDVVNTALNETVDPYRMADRAVKYGILFVLLTFGGFFMFELTKRMLIHPIQYLLVGFCLAIFFLLLVSFSEHMSFALAYLIATASCVGILTYYMIFVLRSREYGLAFGSGLAALYGCVYGLLVSEDNALLLGSLLLFAVIALIMILTRKVDWYQRTASPPSPPPGPPFPAPPYPHQPPSAAVVDTGFPRA
ncbi:MAG TPA: cell envelope integrity protein CreD [Acidobacteriaceae bacterium]|jgi:inner membrane protein